MKKYIIIISIILCAILLCVGCASSAYVQPSSPVTGTTTESGTGSVVEGDEAKANRILLAPSSTLTIDELNFIINYCIRKKDYVDTNKYQMYWIGLATLYQNEKTIRLLEDIRNK